ncbi:MAG: VPLPA-CTERM sorting domain-containing protein [Pseudomonadota bacterium]
MTKAKRVGLVVCIGVFCALMSLENAKAVPVTVNPLLPNHQDLLVPSFGDFNVTFAYQGPPPSAQIINLFEDAANFWESQISGYRTQGLADAIPALILDVTIATIDGVGSILGSAGWRRAQQSDGFTTPDRGAMTFDVDDINAFLGQPGGTDRITAVIIHEMAHTMGYSPSIWDFNNAVAAEDGSGFFTEYAGSFGLEAYNAEFADELGGPVTSIPLEDGGGQGTRGAHWDEQTFGNFTANGGFGDNPEIMTGFLNQNPYLAQTTLFSFQDLGYAVLPLPASVWLMLGGLGALAALRRWPLRASAA